MWNKRHDAIVHEKSPFNAGPAPSASSGREITPMDTFHSRNHGPIPDITTDDWQFTIDGLVTPPLTLSFANLTVAFPLIRRSRRCSAQETSAPDSTRFATSAARIREGLERPPTLSGAEPRRSTRTTAHHRSRLG